MERLIAPLSEGERQALIAAARATLGAPFRHQGRRLKTGVDCIGALVLWFAAIGRALRDRTDYGRVPAQQKLDAALQAHFGPTVPGDPAPGDIVSMAWQDESSHVALVTPHPAYGIGLIHCDLSFGEVVEHGIDDSYRKLILARYVP